MCKHPLKSVHRTLIISICLLLLLPLTAHATEDIVWQPLQVDRLPDLNIPRLGHSVFCAGGEVVAAGGILHQNNNYDVAQTAFLLHVGEATGSWPLWVWIVFDSVLLLFTTIIIIVMLLRNRKHETQKESTQNSGEKIV